MIIIITFCVIIVIQIVFYLFLFGKFSFSKSEFQNDNSFPVSVIICAKNEEKNLTKFLPLIAEQNYPKFEIVLINDASMDNTLEVMQNFKNSFSTNKINIQIITVNKESSKGKKNALTLGINSAKYNHLLLTDADCKPNSNDWIKEMISNFSNEKTIVLGYGAYQKIKKSFLNKIIRFETLLTAIQYFSYAKIGKAYMGVGRNIAYKKDVFIKVKGFVDHNNILSGDDDLFINQVATTINTSICFNKNSFTISEPKTNFKVWLNQKRRHITTSLHYKKIHKLLLGIFYISQVLFWLLAFTLLILKINIFLTILLIITRLSIWYFVIYRSAIKLNEKDLIVFAPIYEISIIFIQLYIFIQNLISSPKHW